MRITTIDEARALVGRTFERDGKRRTFMRLTVARWWVRVVWKHGTRFFDSELSEAESWLSGATEIVTQ